MKITGLTDGIPRPVWEGEGKGGGAGDAPADGGAAAAAAAAAGDASKGGGADAGKPSAAGEKAPTALSAPADDKTVVAPADWPETWREMMAGQDADARKRLDRYKSPLDVAKALNEAQAKISKGIKGSEKPDAADAEAMKAWRKENGVPDDPTGYAIPDSVKALVLPEDKPMLTSFTEEMHKRDWSQHQVNDALEWYYDMQAGIEGQQLIADKASAEATQDALRSEWGREYKVNKEAAHSIAQEIMGDLPWEEARLPADPALGELAGRRLGDIPNVVKALVGISTKIYGDVTLVTDEARSRASNRKGELEKAMGTNEFTPAMRKEYQGIIEAESRGAKR